MGFLKGSFDGSTYKNVEGYRISACFTPENGFQGQFYVYLWDRMEAGTRFENPVNMGAEGRATRGTLELADSERSYKFENIDLVNVQAGVTRRERYRLLEFQMDKEVLNSHDSPITLTNSSTAELRRCALEDDYKYSLGGSSQQLLGFRALVSAKDDTAVRFAALRGPENSFLQKAIDLNKEMRGQNAMPTFTVTFTQGDIEVTRANLNRFYADESYGDLRRLALPKLSELSRSTAQAEIQRLRVDDFTAQELLEHDSYQQFVETQLDPNTVEVGTFVFKPGFHRKVSFT
ncbi:MAG: hypothetical protein U0Q55_16645 [Vicinamibacterales bacterium]